MRLEAFEIRLDFNEVREKVKEHGRLISLMNLIMSYARRTENFIQKLTMKNINDVFVLRRMRLIQLAALANSYKEKIVFVHQG